jgi:hypothetical protein
LLHWSDRVADSTKNFKKLAVRVTYVSTFVELGL